MKLKISHGLFALGTGFGLIALGLGFTILVNNTYISHLRESQRNAASSTNRVVIQQTPAPIKTNTSEFRTLDELKTLIYERQFPRNAYTPLQALTAFDIDGDGQQDVMAVYKGVNAHNSVFVYTNRMPQL